MRTLTRTMIVFVVINLLTAGFALAQTTPTPAEPAPAPTPPTLTDLKEDTKVNDLLMDMPLPSAGRGLFGSSRTNSVLVIPNQEIKAEEILKINEDINVMSRIFDEKLNQERLAASNTSWSFSGGNWMTYGFPTFLGHGGSRAGSMYLQGYGALFLMKVDFPLSAPPDMEKQEEEKPEKEDVDQLWQQTRQQMYEPQETGRRRRGTEREEVKYDAEKVETLKTTLIQALKHAANIRILKPDESVVLSITGSGVSDRIVSIQELPGIGQTIVIKESGGNKTTKVYTGDLPDDIELSSPTVLVIRTKKSDIDSFAKGDLNFDNFRQRVVILSYPLLGENITGTSTSLILPTSRSTGRR